MTRLLLQAYPRIAIQLLVALTAMSALACGGCLDEAEAGKAARRTLTEYSGRESLDVGDFGDPEVRYQQPERVWMFNYTNAKARQQLTIIVGCGGRIETSRSTTNE